jgi:DNA-binding response OmpR family regulator
MLDCNPTPAIEIPMSNGVAAARILIADTDAAIRAAYIASLADDSYVVIEAADGRDALVKALVRVPSLVITELDLPHVDGFALCEILRRDHLTTGVPILVATNRHHPGDIKRAYRAGADVVLSKSSRPEVLAREAARLLAQGQALRVRSTAVLEKFAHQQERSAALKAESVARRAARGAFRRMTTTNPPLQPPVVYCATCGRPLIYEHSYVGGVNVRQKEQWDYYTCWNGCGRFQYRQRTRKLRRIS